MEVATGNRLVTRITTSPPSRRRNVGAGMEQLIVVARRVTPLKLTGVSCPVAGVYAPEQVVGRMMASAVG